MSLNNEPSVVFTGRASYALSTDDRDSDKLTMHEAATSAVDCAGEWGKGIAVPFTQELDDGTVVQLAALYDEDSDQYIVALVENGVPTYDCQSCGAATTSPWYCGPCNDRLFMSALDTFYEAKSRR